MLTEQRNQPPALPPNEAAATTTQETPPPDTLNKMLRGYVADAKRKRELDAELKEIELRMKELEETLLTQFTEGGIQKTTVDGITVYLHREVWPKFLTDKHGNAYTRDDVMKAMKKCGLSDYIKPSYNAQSFAAYCREMEDNGGLPAPLAKVVGLSERFSVRTRSAK